MNILELLQKARSPLQYPARWFGLENTADKIAQSNALNPLAGFTLLPSVWKDLQRTPSPNQNNLAKKEALANMSPEASQILNKIRTQKGVSQSNLRDSRMLFGMGKKGEDVPLEIWEEGAFGLAPRQSIGTAPRKLSPSEGTIPQSNLLDVIKGVAPIGSDIPPFYEPTLRASDIMPWEPRGERAFSSDRKPMRLKYWEGSPTERQAMVDDYYAEQVRLKKQATLQKILEFLNLRSNGGYGQNSHEFTAPEMPMEDAFYNDITNAMYYEDMMR